MAYGQYAALLHTTGLNTGPQMTPTGPNIGPKMTPIWLSVHQ